MPDRPGFLRDVDWRELFLFTHVFRAFRVAIRPSKILLALAAILCMYAGGRVLDAMWPQKYVDQGYEQRMASGRWVFQGTSLLGEPVRPPFAAFEQAQLSNFHAMASNVLNGDWGFESGAPRSLAEFVVLTPLEYWQANKLFFTLLFAWFLVAWALFGGAVARIAAVQVTRDEVISPLSAMRFALKAFPSFIAAPLIPFIMVLILGLVLSVIGLLLYIPYAGPIITGLILVIPLVLGIVMMLLVVGSIAGAGLMYPTIAVEGSDAFDAVSRAMSHVFSAPWRLLFYVAVAIIYGAITYFFVRLCVFVMLWLVHFFVGWWLAGDAGATWLAMWPEPSFSRLTYSPQWDEMNWGGDVGAGVASFWIYLSIAVLGAYVLSFYFSASTIIYLLMRKKVDATEMDQVYLETAEEELPSEKVEEQAKATPVADTGGAVGNAGASGGPTAT